MKPEFMLKALEEAKKSGVDVPVGCVIVKDGKIIAFASNEREKSGKISAHAEIIAIEKAEKILNSWKLDECEMYVTLEPCPMCAGAVVQSRIKNLYFGSYDINYGAMGTVINMVNIHKSKSKVYGGILEEDCNIILNDFFERIRKK